MERPGSNYFAQLTGNHTIDQTPHTHRLCRRTLFFSPPTSSPYLQHRIPQTIICQPAAQLRKCATPTSSWLSSPSSSLPSQVRLFPLIPTSAPQPQLTPPSSLGQDRPLLRRLPHQHPPLHARFRPRPPPRLVHHRQEPRAGVLRHPPPGR